MLKFKINEIPEGKSDLEVQMGDLSMNLESYPLIHARIHVYFERYPSFIRSRFTIEALVKLICDRSLEAFEYPVLTEYSVLFDVNAKEISEDEQVTTKPLEIAGNLISIEEEVRDSILLSIPIKKLHPRFLNEQNEETEFTFTSTDPDSDKISDPRWEKLQALKNKSL